MYNSFCFKNDLEFFVNVCILQFTYSDITHYFIHPFLDILLFFISVLGPILLQIALRLIKSKMNVQLKMQIVLYMSRF